MMKALILVLATAALVVPSRAFAQTNYEIQVYESETVEPGATMVELHSNTAFRGTRETTDGVLPTRQAVHETVEITQGWTSWFETGFYIFTSVQTEGPDQGMNWVGDHIRPRFRAPEEWQLPVGLSLSFEAGYVRPEFSTDTWTLEIRPIIDKQIGPWYVAVNPVFGKSFHGSGSSQGYDFAPSLKVSYQLTKLVAFGIEYYADLGYVGHFDPGKRQQHLLYPTIDLDLGPLWEFNFGVGFGLTSGSDSYIIKAIIGRRFKLFGK
ncbi:MAG TPA: hypothetical protein VMG58_08690 [Candidatus Sulfotelmatobacter sp.]|nr:hypothetical protein [Candidatus Sulfotelmatobacter sp.]